LPRSAKQQSGFLENLGWWMVATSALHRRASAPLTTVTRNAAGILLETDGTEVRVAMRLWPMPLGRGRACGAGNEPDALEKAAA
jgi:hypothetical protein